MNKKVVLLGASSTGKSTVFDLLEKELPDYKFVSESTRTVRSFGFPINEEGDDLTQLAISSFHLQALLEEGNVIYDRGYIDLFVYSTVLYASEKIKANTYRFITDIFANVFDKYTHYIYFPIEFNSVDDGVRSIDEEWRRKVDSRFIETLGWINQDYLTVSGSPKQRVEQILKYINE